MNWDKIREEYESTDITLKALADKHEIKLGTLKSRKSREKWERDATEKKDATPRKEMQEQPIEEKSVFVESEGLTDKQRLFCMYYVKSFNATQSAINAGYSADTAHVQGSRLLSNVKVRAEITAIKAEMRQEMLIDATDVLNKYVKIAFADITDFIKFTDVESTITETEKMYDESGHLTGEKTTIEPYTYTAFRMQKSDQLDGTLLTELSKGKDGMFKVKLADKMKALEMLTKYFDFLPEHQKRRLEEEKVKVSIEKSKLEIERIGGESETDLVDDWVAAMGEVNE